MPRLRALVTVVTSNAAGERDSVAPGAEFKVKTRAEADRLVEIGAAEALEEPAPASSAKAEAAPAQNAASPAIAAAMDADASASDGAED